MFYPKEAGWGEGGGSGREELKNCHPPSPTVL